jgi:hypothetical protein
VPPTAKKLGQILLDKSWINTEQLNRALQAQRAGGHRLGTCLLDIEALPEEILLRALGEQLGVPSASSDELRGVPDATIALLPAKVALRCRAFPFRSSASSVDVAMLDVRNLALQDELGFVVGRRVRIHVALEVRICEALEKHYGDEAPSRIGSLLDRLNRAKFMWDREGAREAARAAPARPVSLELADPFAPPSAVFRITGLTPPPMDLPAKARAVSAPPAPPAVETPTTRPVVTADPAADPAKGPLPTPPKVAAPTEQASPPTPAPRPRTSPHEVAPPPDFTRFAISRPAAAGPPARAAVPSRSTAPAPPAAASTPAEAGAPTVPSPAPPAPQAPAVSAAAAMTPLLPRQLAAIPLAPAERDALMRTTPAASLLSLDELERRLADPADRDEVARLAADFLVQTLPRVVLFMVKKERVAGWLGRGRGIDNQQIESFDVDFTRPSVFLNLRQGSAFYRGPLAPLPVHRELARCWGGKLPRECILVPVRLKERLVTVLYADADGREGATLDLEVFQRLAARIAAGLEAAIVKLKSAKG